ncbi:hypothetical protein ACFOLJ_24090 [Rugamonas sp. CCM 8940]|uniref:hypothetical protein n=1 Tax=Rugamonas sp. CCM 8940 TaxID=2765359 RepID=UPI0018F5BCCB|nr:hypothetical protein [Rugamonas sp. CCM 8940]MBJ7309186.1 hypothetical protein [Rugamonas sp. CCM 8940]
MNQPFEMLPFVVSGRSPLPPQGFGARHRARQQSPYQADYRDPYRALYPEQGRMGAEQQDERGTRMGRGGGGGGGGGRGGGARPSGAAPRAGARPGPRGGQPVAGGAQARPGKVARPRPLGKGAGAGTAGQFGSGPRGFVPQRGDGRYGRPHPAPAGWPRGPYGWPYYGAYAGPGWPYATTAVFDDGADGGYADQAAAQGDANDGGNGNDFGFGFGNGNGFANDGSDGAADGNQDQQEFAMQTAACQCAKCLQREAAGFEVMRFGAPAAAAPFSPQQEEELAMELLSVTSEAELEQFLGNVFKSVWKGVKKVAAPLGGALKAVAKQALPFVGGALGSMIPIPGVGTALGTALGRAASNALEMEFEGMEPVQREYETARRFVRLAGSAAQLAGRGDGSPGALRGALLVSLRRHLPYISPDPVIRARGTLPTVVTGRWRRRGNRIVLMGDW